MIHDQLIRTATARATLTAHKILVFESPLSPDVFDQFVDDIIQLSCIQLQYLQAALLCGMEFKEALRLAKKLEA